MNARILLDGRIVEELMVAKTLVVNTKCPDKWILVDMETGEQYIGHRTDGSNDWRKLPPDEWVSINA
jgi:hypothetical protein